MNEEWRIIDKFPSYAVSNHGRIRSIQHRKGGRAAINDGIINGWIKPSKTGKPVAVMVSLRHDGKTHTVRVHRLVVETFIGEAPNASFEICHNDGNPLNNSVSNLRWDSHRNNVRDSITHGTKVDPPHYSGEAHPRRKISKEQEESIRNQPYFRGLNSRLAEQYGVSITHIGRIRANGHCCLA